jgi:hypothetical protein
MALRVATMVIAIWGVRSSFEIAFGSKLMLTYSLEMWDCNESTVGFFINKASIVGLYALRSARPLRSGCGGAKTARVGLSAMTANGAKLPTC